MRYPLSARAYEPSVDGTRAARLLWNRALEAKNLHLRWLRLLAMTLCDLDHRSLDTQGTSYNTKDLPRVKGRCVVYRHELGCADA